jgi:L-threonylcarbamoyladenylate synthase
VSQVQPASDASIARAAAIILAGGLVCFPTDTVYAVACLAGDGGARDRLYAVKGRDATQPSPVLAEDAAALLPWVAIDQRARRLMTEFWPGPLTLVLPATPRAVAELGQVVSDGTLGVRVPDSPTALAILRAVGRLVAASSANLSGQPPAVTGAEAAANLGAEVELVVDGSCELRVGSSILDLTQPEPRLLREGGIPAQRLIR